MTSRWFAGAMVVAVGAACSSEETAAGTADATASDVLAADGASVDDTAGASDTASESDGASDDLGSDEDVAATDDVGPEDAVVDDVPPSLDVATDITPEADVPAVPDDTPVVPDDGPAVPDDVPVAPDVEDDAGPAPTGGGETCEEAIDLRDASGPTGGMDYPYIVTGGFGGTDDLNPLDSSGLAPGCSLVYDAKGKEVVYTIELEPGEILDMRYMVTPVDHPGGLYILDSCTTWPDYDGSGKCGSNEYKSQGYCGVTGQCDPIEFNFLYPDTYSTKQRFWIVLDEVAGDSATSYTFEWNVIPPK